MKKPKPQPRAVPRPRPIVANSDVLPSNAPQAPSGAHSAVSTTTTAPPEQTHNHAILPPPTYIARLPSYTDIITLSRAILPFFTFSYARGSASSRGSSPAHANHLPSKPWATPVFIQRVKFELLLAYVLVQRERQVMIESGIPLAEPPDGQFVAALEDGSFAAVVQEVFSLQGGEENLMFKAMIFVTASLPVD